MEPTQKLPTLNEWHEYLAYKLGFCNRNDWGNSKKYNLYIKTLGEYKIFMSIHFTGESMLIIFKKNDPILNEEINLCTIDTFESKILEYTGIEINKTIINYSI